jgi:ribosome-associated translation inhibitor RaiA
VVVTLAKADHHATGEFHVEVRVDVEKHDDFVIHQQGLDLYGAIDGAMHKAERLLHEHKERIKPGMHRER